MSTTANSGTIVARRGGPLAGGPASAPPRPPQGEPVCVTAFGAVGDGKTDCTAAVAAAIAYIHSQRPPLPPGPTPPPATTSHPVPALVFPAGKFVLNAPLLVDCFTVEGAGPTTTSLIFSNTKRSSAGPTAQAGYAVVLGTTWDQMRAMGDKYVAAKNLSIVGGSDGSQGVSNPNTLHGMLLHSLFQAQGAVENVHINNFCASGAVGMGLCNVQDICFRSCKVNNCYIGLQLNAATKSEPGDRGNFNTNLLFDNFIAQSCRMWSIACLPGNGGADNITFVGGVTQGKDSQAGGLVNLANIGTLGFYGHYFEVVPPVHHELTITDVDQCVLSNCHFTSIGAMVTVSGTTSIEVSSCSFPSKFCQSPKPLPNGARLSLSNGAQACVVACSPQLSVGPGCKATLVGFDHGKPGGKTGNPITGGGGTIIDLSNPQPQLGKHRLVSDEGTLARRILPSPIQLLSILMAVLALAFALDLRIKHHLRMMV